MTGIKISRTFRKDSRISFTSIFRDLFLSIKLIGRESYSNMINDIVLTIQRLHFCMLPYSDLLLYGARCSNVSRRRNVRTLLRVSIPGSMDVYKGQAAHTHIHQRDAAGTATASRALHPDEKQRPTVLDMDVQMQKKAKDKDSLSGEKKSSHKSSHALPVAYHHPRFFRLPVRYAHLTLCEHAGDISRKREQLSPE